MKYKVTLNGRTYEVEVEAGKAMLVDEYEAYAPAPAAAAAPVATPAAPATAPAAPVATVAGSDCGCQGRLCGVRRASGRSGVRGMAHACI